MSFASDKLANGYLRRNMSTLVNRVKVREIIIHLPCLTAHDRENIEAKRETCGNYDGMALLLECLKRRENWLEQLIEALEVCEQPSIAAEIRAEYNALRGVNSSNPGSPSTTVVRAHVHAAPPASPLSIPDRGGNAQAAVAPPAEASARPGPAAQASLPQETPVRPQAQTSAAHVPDARGPSEPVPEAPQSTQIEVAPPPLTPAPSRETPHSPASAPPQRKVHAHQEPEENSESDIQIIFVDNGVSPAQVSTGKDTLQTTATAEVRPPQSPSPTQANSDVTDGSSFPTLTPERPPVQDTTPLVNKIPFVLTPDKISEPPTTQVVESSPQTQTAATTSPLPGAAGMSASAFDDSTLCLSKPGQLVSIQPQNHDSPTAHNSPTEPYSGDSQRLEMSKAEPDAVTSAHVPACSGVTSATTNTVSALSCQENGIALDHNEPEENAYESPCQSLDTQEVRVNVVTVSEEPSILNLDGQTSAPRDQIINGEAARAITPSPTSSTTTADTVSSLNTPPSESYHPSEPAPADITPEPKTLPASRTLQTNTKYIVTAAGVGAIALLMAWRFKN
ncbi:mitochondrial antiviral-signaling protein isoform X2 [Xiphias gladius]|uniref:mitochondrial antiviral-signaling protein isoform X2 n=1 Tax=Xiphias gladius TaxID=8245 RepID=UPI001A998CF5|nr:mitochondrial antiviral-signaling protein isoform X2 [Xiphias gladius]